MRRVFPGPRRVLLYPRFSIIAAGMREGEKERKKVRRSNERGLSSAKYPRALLYKHRNECNSNNGNSNSSEQQQQQQQGATTPSRAALLRNFRGCGIGNKRKKKKTKAKKEKRGKEKFLLPCVYNKQRRIAIGVGGGGGSYRVSSAFMERGRPLANSRGG